MLIFQQNSILGCSKASVLIVYGKLEDSKTFLKPISYNWHIQSNVIFSFKTQEHQQLNTS
jgi:hypothetical protein